MRSHSVLGVLGGLGLWGALVVGACTESSSDTPATDAGTTPDAPSPVDEGGMPDTSMPDACTPGLPPSGFTALAEGDNVGINADIVTVAGGAPVVAYTAPEGDRLAIWMQRWDATCGRWEARVKVDTTALHTSGTSRQVALAYDAASGAVGIVYQEITAPLGMNEKYEIRFASWAKGAAAPSMPERVDDATVNPDPDHGRTSPGLAMANGSVFVAWHQAYRTCNVSGCDAIVYRTKSSAGAWSSESVAPTLPNMVALAASTAVAVDGDGAPAVAFVAANHDGPDRTEIDFWRPGGALVAAFGGDVGTDDPNVALAFAGKKPRIAAAIHLSSTWPTDNKTTWFSASNDGATWSPPVDIPRDKGSTFGAFVGLAVTGDTSAAVVADINGGDGTMEYGTPKIARTTDLGTFATKGPERSAFENPSKWVHAASGADGKLQIVFFNPPGSTTVKTGFVYYRE